MIMTFMNKFVQKIKIIISLLRYFVFFDLLFTMAEVGLGLCKETLNQIPLFKKRDMKLETVLITGGASGIGKLMAELFLKEGSRVVIVDINKKELGRVRNQFSSIADGRLTTYVCDVGSFDNVKELYETVRKEIGDITILVNNAGIVTGKGILNSTEDDVLKNFRVNTFSSLWTIMKFLPSMIEKNNGQIVTIASAAGLMGTPGLVDYSASKHAAVGLTESIRLDLRRKGATGVSTTLICPYYINTGMFDGVQTRFSFLLPVLEPEYVAKKSFVSIKKKRSMVVIPKFIYSVYILRYMPTVVFDLCAKFLGLCSTMDHFVGRQKKDL